MTIKSQDIRITKTRMALSITLMELLEKKSFRKITVNDICQNAMVSRSTFYMHFEDKYQLMLFCLQMERQRLYETAQNMDLQSHFKMVLTLIYERKKVFYNFLRADLDMELFDMFKNFFHNYITDILNLIEQQGVKLPGPIPILAVYYASGLTGIFIWWIEQDFSASIDEMAACVYNLLVDIIPDKENESLDAMTNQP